MARIKSTTRIRQLNRKPTKAQLNRVANQAYSQLLRLESDIPPNRRPSSVDSRVTGSAEEASVDEVGEVLEILRREKLANHEAVYLIRWSTDELTWQFENEMDNCDYLLLKFFNEKSIPLVERPPKFRTVEVPIGNSADGYCAKRSIEHIIQKEIPDIKPQQPFSYYESLIQAAGFRMKRLSDPEKRALPSWKSGKILCYNQGHFFTIDCDLQLVVDSEESRPINGNIPFFQRAYYLQKK